MKIIQVTDAHLVRNRQEMHGVNSFDRLTACIRDIEENHSDADLCIFTGDLTHEGHIGAYRDLARILEGFSLPYRLMVGNHDLRGNLLAVFSDVPTDPNGFIQSSIDTDAGRLILLDTVAEGQKHGAFCKDRADWLAQELKTASDRPVYLFLHHPPFNIGLPNVDRMRLKEGDDILASTLAPYDNIQHMFCGHVHRPTAGNWNGISFSSFRGTAHQVALRLTETQFLVRSHEPPAYGVILLNPGSTVVHFHDYLDDTAFWVTA